MKSRQYIWIIALMILVSLSYQARAEIRCNLTESCSTSATEVLHISALTNAHAELANQSNYNYTVCCKGATRFALNCSNERTAELINISAVTNAHAGSPSVTSYTESICLAADSGTLTCEVTTSACTEACLIAISATDNAHLENCSAGTYPYYVCCAHAAYVAPGGGGGAAGGLTSNIKQEEIAKITVQEAEEEEEKKSFPLVLIFVFIIIAVLLLGVILNKVKSWFVPAKKRKEYKQEVT